MNREFNGCRVSVLQSKNQSLDSMQILPTKFSKEFEEMILKFVRKRTRANTAKTPLGEEQGWERLMFQISRPRYLW